MFTIWCVTLLSLAAPESASAAMVLDVSGSVTRTTGDGPSKPLKEMDILRSGDIVKTAASAKAVFVFLSDGHRETLKSASQITVSEKGSQPAGAVVREEKKLPLAHLASLQKFAGSGQAG